jgi:hypothetical protein
MLSNIPDVRAAANWRAGSSLAALDAGLPGGVRATLLRDVNICGTDLRGTVALAIPRPHAVQGTLMPGLRQVPGQTSAFGEQDTRKKYEHATRVAVLDGSATGSHPASWDPV